MLRFTCCFLSCFLASNASAKNLHSILDRNDSPLLLEGEENTPEAELSEARLQLAQGNFKKAQHLTTLWLETHPRSLLAAEAYLIRGDALYEQMEYYEALFDYEMIAQNYYEGEHFQIALEKEFEIATLFAHGTLRKKWGMRFLDATSEAEDIFYLIHSRVGGSPLAESAGMELADLYYRRADMDLAAEAYQLFIENYPMSHLIVKAKSKLISARMATYRGPAFDDKGLIDARDELLQLQIMNPSPARQIVTDELSFA